MPTPPPRPEYPGPIVTAVLLSHDGARWLPETLSAVAGQTRPPERFVCVDTGSRDESVEVVAAGYGESTVVRLDRGTGLGDALRSGLAAFDGEAADAATQEWVWILHDDCAPEPDALAELLARVEGSPSVWLAGPKLRSWDGDRLLEAGLSIDPGGRLDTGLDGAELDQGQRDDVDEVLAVGTAGALLRRDAWDRLGGMDPGFALYADDIDLGWRINAADGRVVLAPRAVVRHAAALTYRRRDPAAVTGSPDVVRRRHGLQVVLVNTSAWLVPLLVARYVVGAVFQALGLLLLAHRPRDAAVELRAAAGVVVRIPTLLRARRRRRAQRVRSHGELRGLFPPAGTRWRHAMAAAGLGRLQRAGRGGTRAMHETGPVAEEAESLDAGDSPLASLLRRPGVAMVAVLTVLAMVADRHLFGALLHGGRLLPAPPGADDLWSSYLGGWHPAGVGAGTAAPPSLGVLAALSTVAFGKPWLVVDVLFLGAVPLAAFSAYTALRSVTTASRIRVWVAVVYSLLPAVTGAVAAGRLDVVVAVVLLPQVIRALAAAVGGDPRQHGWHRGVGAGLLLALLTAFTPVLWLAAVVAVVVALAVTVTVAASAERSAGSRVLAAVLALGVAPLVLLPWTWHVVGDPSLLLSGTGLPESYASRTPPSGWLLVLLHAGGPAQPPFWVGIPVVAAAVLGLRRTRNAIAARLGVVLLVLGIALAIAQTRPAGVSVGSPASRYWPGPALLLAASGALLTATVAAMGARPALRRQSFGWRQPAAIVLVAVALVSTGVLVGHWLLRGAGTPLRAAPATVLPLFAQAEIAVPASPRALVIDGSGPAVRYAVVRRPSGPRLGSDDLLPGADGSRAEHRASGLLGAAVRDLVAGRPGAGDELVAFGIGYVVVPGGAEAPGVGSAIGRSGTFTLVPTSGAAVWRSTEPAGELTVLAPADAAAAVGGRVTRSASVAALPARPGRADAAVPAGPAGRLAVLAEPRDAHWRATLDGHRLPARTAYGWAQAFELPANGGRLHVSFQDPARGVLLALELALLVMAGLLAVPSRPDASGAHR